MEVVNWEYVYNSENNSITAYHTTSSDVTIEFYIFLVAVIIGTIIVVVLITKIKSRKPKKNIRETKKITYITRKEKKVISKETEEEGKEI